MRKAGIAFVCMGLLFLLGAAALLLYNKQEDAMAGKAAEEQLSLLVDRIQVQKDQQTTTVPSDSVEATNADELLLLPPTEKKEEEIMESIEVQGNGYIGYLSFPTLEMDLPVMSDWSVQKLYTAPCHYYGTAKGGNLVIMAHNYNHHFGRLTELRAGDPVYFVNIFGEPFFYEVVLQEILPPDCIPELTEGTYDLTLFTCTYGGANRITVRLNEAPPPQ